MKKKKPLAPKEKVYLIAVRAIDDDTQQLTTEIFGFKRKDARDDMAQECDKLKIEYCTSEDDISGYKK